VQYQHIIPPKSGINVVVNISKKAGEFYWTYEIEVIKAQQSNHGGH